MKSVAVIQARTNSSRLPGKVLLPLNGIPLVILASTRAANTGRKVIVATSNEKSDDGLANMLGKHGIQYYRGSLENTLERIVTALKEYEDDTLVFRLTADNVVPDGELLDQIEKEFLKKKLDYLCCNGEKSGLPYGVSAELTFLRHLREALSEVTSKYDQEHVTPFIRRKFGERYFEKYVELNKGHFRCTVDCLDDYLSIQQVFSQVDDPILEPALDLIQKMDSGLYQPCEGRAASKLVLGTAQLGMNYGIANRAGKPDQKLAEQLIKTAIANGATYIDTARSYGTSEEVIGNVLKSGWQGRVAVITKLAPLADCPTNATPDIVNAFVDASVYHSCQAMRTQALDVLMLHRSSHMTDWSGAAWQRLLKHKSDGTLKRLGVSIQTPEQLEVALDSNEIEVIQMPFNVMDWRWDHLQDRIRDVKQRRELLIHVRSTLLQGLLTSDSSEHWALANVDESEHVVAWLKQQSMNAGKLSVTELCISFVKSLDWVDGIVIGMESMEQLAENVRILCGPDIVEYDLHTILSTRPRLDERSLNPACWKGAL